MNAPCLAVKIGIRRRHPVRLRVAARRALFCRLRTGRMPVLQASWGWPAEHCQPTGENVDDGQNVPVTRESPLRAVDQIALPDAVLAGSRHFPVALILRFPNSLITKGP